MQLVADADGEHVAKAVLVVVSRYGRYGSHTAPYGAQLAKDTHEDGARRRGIGTLPNSSTSRFKVRATKSIRSDEEVLVSSHRS